MILSESPRIEFLSADCMDVMKGYADKQFELAIVDPPYGIFGAEGTTGTNWKQYKKWGWDENRPDKTYFDKLYNVSKNQIIFGGNYFVKYLKSSMGWIVWDKVQRLDSSDCELMYSSFDAATRIFSFARGNNQGFLNPDRFHPTQKPVALYKWLLKNYAKTGDKILDTHGGSFSSAIACHQMGFDFVGIEKDAEYFEKAVKRFKQYESQGRLFDGVK